MNELKQNNASSVDTQSKKPKKKIRIKANNNSTIDEQQHKAVPT